MKKLKILLLTLIIAAVSFSALTVNAAAADHVVVRGDSLWRISRSYGVSLEELIAANPQIKDPNLIYPGDRVYVPDGKTDHRQSVLRATNRYRSSNGVSSLVMDAELCRVAQAKADDMAAKGYFSHQSPTYGSPSDMLRAFGVSYRYMGENIAKGYGDAESVVQGWMNSAGHRANILNASFTRLGVGYSPNGNVWVQIFIG